MTATKEARVSQYIACLNVVFKEPLAVFATDVIELDIESKRARVVNRAGKIKASVPFKVKDHGSETGTGS